MGITYRRMKRTAAAKNIKMMLVIIAARQRRCLCIECTAGGSTIGVILSTVSCSVEMSS